MYSIDPDADGYGIYLVFWFGVDTTPSDRGEVPSSAEELELLLQARVPEGDAYRLRVVAMDLSWPDYAKPRAAKKRVKRS